MYTRPNVHYMCTLVENQHCTAASEHLTRVHQNHTVGVHKLSWLKGNCNSYDWLSISIYMYLDSFCEHVHVRNRRTCSLTPSLSPSLSLLAPLSPSLPPFLSPFTCSRGVLADRGLRWPGSTGGRSVGYDHCHSALLHWLFTDTGQRRWVEFRHIQYMQ